MATMEPDLVVYHPNRRKATSKATKGVVVILLLASAGLIAVITGGGWSSLQGQQFVAIAYILIYCVMAYYIARWSRGMLPLAAGLAVLLGVFATMSVPGWFDRQAFGYDNPGLPPGLIGTLTVALIGVQLLLIIFAMRGFAQQWNVEIERPRHEVERGRGYRQGPYFAQPGA